MKVHRLEFTVDVMVSTSQRQYKFAKCSRKFVVIETPKQTEFLHTNCACKP